MELTIVVRLSDRTLGRTVDRPYPGIPQPGDWLDLDEEGRRRAEVEDRFFDSGGRIFLTVSLKTGEPADELADELEGKGYGARYA